MSVQSFDKVFHKVLLDYVILVIGPQTETLKMTNIFELLRGGL